MIAHLCNLLLIVEGAHIYLSAVCIILIGIVQHPGNLPNIYH